MGTLIESKIKSPQIAISEELQEPMNEINRIVKSYGIIDPCNNVAIRWIGGRFVIGFGYNSFPVAAK